MSRRLRVLFAIGSLAGGGSERQTIRILHQLDRTRFEPSLYLLDRSGEFLRDVPDDVPVIAFSDDAQPGGIYVPGKIFRRQVDHLSRTLGTGAFDVLYDRTILMACVGGPASRRANVRRVAAVVADPQRDVRDSFQRFRWAKRRILQRGYDQAASVVANSEGLRRAVTAEYRLAENKVVAIPNGFDFEALEQLASAESPVSFEPGFTHVVALGRFSPEKGIADLLRSVRSLVFDRGRNDIVLWLVGSGPEEPVYRELIAQTEGLERHVRFTGFQTNPFAVLSRASVFCLSSRSEGAPNALVEAMACGVPVVSTDCAHGPREILADGQLGELVSPGDCTAMADAVERVLDDEPSARRRAERAAESVRERFDIAQTTRELEQLLMSVAPS